MFGKINIKCSNVSYGKMKRKGSNVSAILGKIKKVAM